VIDRNLVQTVSELGGAALVVISLLVGLCAADPGERGGEGRLNLVAGPAAKGLRPKGKVLILFEPRGAAPSQVLEDAVSAELISAGTQVVSREKRFAVEVERLKAAGREVDEGEEKGRSEKEKEGFPGLLGVAREAGAELLILATALVDVVQRNVYDEQTGRPAEVRSEQVIQAVSCTVVRVRDGELLAAGCADYSTDPRRVVPVGREVGKAVVALLR